MHNRTTAFLVVNTVRIRVKVRVRAGGLGFGFGLVRVRDRVKIRVRVINTTLGLWRGCSWQSCVANCNSAVVAVAWAITLRQRDHNR